MNKGCFICSGRIKFFLSGRDFLYQTSQKTWDIYKCESCGLEQINPCPSDNEIRSFYPSNYYSYNFSKKPGMLTKFKKIIITYSYSDGYIRKILAIIFNWFLFFGLPFNKKGKRMFLDIGCGDGYDVRLMSKCGWDSYGFEIGEKNKKDGVYFDSDFSYANFEGLKFDYIRIWHVLEHVKNPTDFLEKLVELLDDNGQIALALPNMRSLQAYLFGKYCFNRDIPRHLYNYNLENLNILLEKNGLKIVKIKGLSLNSFSGTLQHLINNLLNKKFQFHNNSIWILFFYPFECLMNVLGISDVVYFKIKKSK